MKGKIPFSDLVRLLTVLILAALLNVQGCSRIEIRDKDWRWSSADGGLAIREGPGLWYERIGIIPYGAKVRVINTVSPQTTLDGRTGRWSRVLYRGQIGYAFDAYLSEEPPAETTVSGDVLAATADRKSFLAESQARERPEKGALASKPPEKKASEPAPPPDKPETAPKKPALNPSPNPPAPPEEPPEKPAPAASSSPSTQPASPQEPQEPERPAYAAHDSDSLIKLNRDEFSKIAETLRKQAMEAKYAYRSIPGFRGEKESIEEYLKRAEDAKRLFLKKLRQEEHAAATRVYSIKDAPLEMGSYDRIRSRFDWLGTSVPIGNPKRVATVPGGRGENHRFINGRKQGVEIPPELAGKLKALQDRILVRIDFSFTVSLQDLFDWTLQAYFLPRYLALYNAETGRLYYECRTLQEIELPGDPAAPLRISSRLVDETVH